MALFIQMINSIALIFIINNFLNMHQRMQNLIFNLIYLIIISQYLICLQKPFLLFKLTHHTRINYNIFLHFLTQMQTQSFNCKFNRPVTRFTIHDYQIILLCCNDSCQCSIPYKTKYSIQNTVKFLKWKQFDGLECLEEVVEFYNSCIKTLEQQRDLLVNKIQNKKQYALSSIQSQFLELLQMAQSKNFELFQEKKQIFTSNMSLVISHCLKEVSWQQDKQVCTKQLRKELSQQVSNSEKQLQVLCSSIRKYWTKDQTEGVAQFVESRRERENQSHFRMSLKPPFDRYYYSSEMKNENLKKILEEENLLNLKQMYLSAGQKAEYLVHYSPQLEKVSFSVGSRKPNPPFNRINRNSHLGNFFAPTPLPYPMMPPNLIFQPRNLNNQGGLIQMPQLPPFLLPGIPIDRPFPLLKILEANKKITHLNISLNSDHVSDNIMFRRLSKGFEHLKQLFISGISKITDDDLKLMAQNLKNLQKFSMFLSTNFKTIFIQIQNLSKIPYLKTLRLGNFEGQFLFQSDFGTLQSLEELEFKQLSNLYNKTMQSICRVPNLRILKIHKYTETVEEHAIYEYSTEYLYDSAQQLFTLKSLFQAISKCAKLQELNLYDTLQKQSITSTMIKYLMQVQNFSKLFIEDRLIQSQQIMQLCTKFDLKLLDCAMNQKQNEYDLMIRNPLGPPHITTNKKKISSLTPENLNAIIKMIPNITELRLDGHPIGDYGAMVIGSELKKLRKVSLYDCGISNMGVFYISKLLLLQGLYLGSNLSPRPLKILYNCQHLIQLKINNLKSKFRFVRNNVRNQYLKVSSTLINLKTLTTKSEFDSISGTVVIPIQKMNSSIKQNNYYIGIMNQSDFNKEIFKLDFNRYTFTNERIFSLQVR